jgi:hypothetical protein
MIVVAPRPVGSTACAGPAAGSKRDVNMMIASRASVWDAAAIARDAAIQGASRTAEVPPRAGFPDSKDWEATA